MFGRLRATGSFRIHAQAFRRTFVTVACQMGWGLERLRAATGRRSDWAEPVPVPGRPDR